MKNNTLLKDKYILTSIIVMLLLLFYLLLFDVVILSDANDNCCSTKFILPILWLTGLIVWLILGGLIVIRLYFLKPFKSELQNIVYIIIVISTVYYSSVSQLQTNLDEYQKSIDLIHHENKQIVNTLDTKSDSLTEQKNSTSIMFYLLISILIVWLVLISITLILIARKKPKFGSN